MSKPADAGSVTPQCDRVTPGWAVDSETWIGPPLLCSLTVQLWEKLLMSSIVLHLKTGNCHTYIVVDGVKLTNIWEKAFTWLADNKSVLLDFPPNSSLQLSFSEFLQW